MGVCVCVRLFVCVCALLQLAVYCQKVYAAEQLQKLRKQKQNCN